MNKLEAGCVELDDGSKFELVEKLLLSWWYVIVPGGGAEEASRTQEVAV